MKTTIYIPDDVKEALARRATIEHRSEASIVRDALVDATRGFMFPPPRKLPVPDGPPTNLAEHVDELLAAFGEPQW